MARSKFDTEIEHFFEKNWYWILFALAGFGIWKKQDFIVETLRNTFYQVFPFVKWGFWIVVIGICVWIVCKIIRFVLLYVRETKTYEYALVIPHESDEVDLNKLGHMIRQVHRSGRKPLERLIKGRDWYRLLLYRPKECEGEKQAVQMYIGGTKEGLPRILQAFRSVYKHAEMYPQPIEDVPFPTNQAVGGRLFLLQKKLQATLPLAKYKKDVLSTLLHAMQQETWVDLSFSPDNGYRLRKGIQKAEKEMKQHKKEADLGLNAFEREELQALHKRFSNNEVAFRVAVSFASEAYEGVQAIRQLGHMVESFMADVNALRYKKWRKWVIPKVPCPLYGDMMWTGSELLNLLHLPHIQGEPDSVEEKSILFIPKGQEMLPENVLRSGLTIGYLKHPLYTTREVAIHPKQLCQHGNVTGGVGSGKTTVISQMLQSVIDRFVEGGSYPAGFSLFDPKPEIGIIMLNRLLKAEQEGKKVDWSKVHYIRLRDTAYPPALNLFHRSEGEDIQKVVDTVMTLIKTAIPGHAQQTERLLKAIIGTLLCDGKQEHTVLSIGKFLNDEVFRARVLANLEGTERQYYRNYWMYEVDTTLEDSKQAILNRLDIFRNTAYLKRMYGQTGFGLDIRRWMDEGHLVFYDVSGMSETDVNLTLGYIANQYHTVAQQRQQGNKTHLLVIDEAHQMQVPILPTIIAQDRSFGLALWIITQSLTGQLNKELVNAMKEIGANFFICQQGAENADIYEKITQRHFRAAYLKNLPELTAAIQTKDKVNGETKPLWCTITVPPLDKYLPNGDVATYGDREKQQESDAWTYTKIQELERRGKHISEIDEELNAFLYDVSLVSSEKKRVSLEKCVVPASSEPLLPEHTASEALPNETGPASQTPETVPSVPDRPLETKSIQRDSLF